MSKWMHLEVIQLISIFRRLAWGMNSWIVNTHLLFRFQSRIKRIFMHLGLKPPTDFLSTLRLIKEKPTKKNCLWNFFCIMCLAFVQLVSSLVETLNCAPWNITKNFNRSFDGKSMKFIRSVWPNKMHEVLSTKASTFSRFCFGDLDQTLRVLGKN